MVDLRAVSRHYDGKCRVVALDRLDLAIPRGRSR